MPGVLARLSRWHACQHDSCSSSIHYALHISLRKREYPEATSGAEELGWGQELLPCVNNGAVRGEVGPDASLWLNPGEITPAPGNSTGDFDGARLGIGLRTEGADGARKSYSSSGSGKCEARRGCAAGLDPNH